MYVVSPDSYHVIKLTTYNDPDFDLSKIQNHEALVPRRVEASQSYGDVKLTTYNDPDFNLSKIQNWTWTGRPRRSVSCFQFSTARPDASVPRFWIFDRVTWGSLYVVSPESYRDIKLTTYNSPDFNLSKIQQ